MEYFVLDVDGVGRLVTKDLDELKAFLVKTPNWDKILKRKEIGDTWKLIANRTDYDLCSSAIF